MSALSSAIARQDPSVSASTAAVDIGRHASGQSMLLPSCQCHPIIISYFLSATPRSSQYVGVSEGHVRPTAKVGTEP